MTDDLVNDCISRQAAIEAMRKAKDKSELHRMLVQLPSAQPSATTDTISRQALIYAIEEVPWYHQNENGVMVHGANSTEHDAWYMAEDIYHVLDTLPSEQPGWIPVTERLPENDNDVLVTDGTDCAVAYWRTDAQAWDDCMHGWCDLYGLEVTAWMPLPKPWGGGQDG